MAAKILVALLFLAAAVSAQSGGSGGGGGEFNFDDYSETMVVDFIPDISFLSDPCADFANYSDQYFICMRAYGDNRCHCPGWTTVFTSDFTTPTPALGFIQDCYVALTDKYPDMNPYVVFHSFITPCHNHRLYAYYQQFHTFWGSRRRSFVSQEEYEAKIKAGKALGLLPTEKPSAAATSNGGSSGVATWAIVLIASGVALIAMSAVVVVRRRKAPTAAATLAESDI